MHVWYVSKRASQFFHFEKHISYSSLVSFSQGFSVGFFLSGKAIVFIFSVNIYSSTYIFCVALSAPILTGVNEVMVASRWFFVDDSHLGIVVYEK